MAVSHNYFQLDCSLENKRSIEFKVVINWTGTCMNESDSRGTEGGQEEKSNDDSWGL